MYTALFLTTLFLAYTNGANDNFKGVATLFGSQATRYRTALGTPGVTEETVHVDTADTDAVVMFQSAAIGEIFDGDPLRVGGCIAERA